MHVIRKMMRLREIQAVSNSAYWDAEASTYDEAADHGLRDPLVRDRWRQRLGIHLPGDGFALDVGCGTGSLSLLLAELGYEVTGIDSSPRMIEEARRKASAANREITFTVGDAADPKCGDQRFDVILGRHILWAVPDAALALRRWTDLLRRGGQLVLIEGFWHTGLGLHRRQVETALPESVEIVRAEDLGGDSMLWGGNVRDERFLVVARLRH